MDAGVSAFLVYCTVAYIGKTKAQIANRFLIYNLYSLGKFLKVGGKKHRYCRFMRHFCTTTKVLANKLIADIVGILDCLSSNRINLLFVRGNTRYYPPPSRRTYPPLQNPLATYPYEATLSSTRPEPPSLPNARLVSKTSFLNAWTILLTLSFSTNRAYGFYVSLLLR